MSPTVHISFDDKQSEQKAVDNDSKIGSILYAYPGYEFTCGDLLNYDDAWNTLGDAFIIATTCDDVLTIKITNENNTNSITTKMSSKKPIGAAFALFEQEAHKKNKKAQQWSYCYLNKPVSGDDYCKDFSSQSQCLSEVICLIAYIPLVNCYPGISFSDTIDKEMVLFDKSQFIENVLERRKSTHSLILRPRRFGKSFNLRMLSYFLDVNKTPLKLVNNLRILERKDLCEKHMNKYPIILISFNGVVCSTFEETKSAIFYLLTKVVNEFTYLLDSGMLTEIDKQKLSQYQKQADENALEHLVDCLYKHHQSKIVLLIDEYDSPLMGSVYTCFRKEIFEIFANTFSFLKRTEYIEFSIFMGIILLTDTGYLSGLNNLCYYSTQSDDVFKRDFGITHNELSSVLKQIRGNEYPGLEIELDNLRRWYNGYDVDNSSKVIFNMWSLCTYFALGKISNYWISTGATGELAQLLNNDSIDDLEMIEELETLKDGGEIEINMSLEVDVSTFTCGQIKRKHELFWKLMFYAGYLTGSKTPQTEKVKRSGNIQTDSRKNPFFLRCPNEEVRSNIESSFISKIETRNTSWNEISSSPSPGRDEVNDMIDIELSYLDNIYMDATYKTTLTDYSSLTKLLAQLIPNDVKKKPFSYQYIHPTRNTNVELTDISVGNGYLSKIFSSQNLIKFIGKKK